MKNLMIKDLARAEELGRDAMAAVRGGYSMSAPASYALLPYPVNYSPSSDSSVHATQGLEQYQNVVNATADDAAFLHDVHATNTTTQFGQNNILVYR